MTYVRQTIEPFLQKVLSILLQVSADVSLQYELRSKHIFGDSWIIYDFFCILSYPVCLFSSYKINSR